MDHEDRFLRDRRPGRLDQLQLLSLVEERRLSVGAQNEETRQACWPQLLDIGAQPAGSNFTLLERCTQRWDDSPSSSVVIASGTPPTSETR